MFRIIVVSKIMVLGLIVGITLSQAFSRVIGENGKTYIVDRHGERWDITQAVSIGFQPHRFQHGIGRHAFTPLDDSDFSARNDGARRNERVIGIAEGEYANAYAVSKLWRHEVANSHIGEKPIAAAF
ncbi:MAG: DUF3179 domain-containing protein [Deltaproteobacteria bacterium]|jgi:hypothetical protein|nr:DUF3179 domain-containing protein [Deltaproteobacteria bacterium]